MAQQDPCWIDLQSSMNSTLYKLLRTSSANTVSVSVAEAKRCSFSLFHLVWSGKLKCIFLTINTREANEVQGLPHLFCSSILFSAALQHCIIKLQYITVLNQYLKKFSVLQRYYTVDSISTPRYQKKIIHSRRSQYSMRRKVHPGASSEFSNAGLNIKLALQLFDSTVFVCTGAGTGRFWYNICSIESATDLHPLKMKKSSLHHSTIVVLNPSQVSTDSAMAQ